jgi:hypothetical protein
VEFEIYGTLNIPHYNKNTNLTDCYWIWKAWNKQLSCYAEVNVGNWSDGEEQCQRLGGYLPTLPADNGAVDMTKLYPLPFWIAPISGSGRYGLHSCLHTWVSIQNDLLNYQKLTSKSYLLQVANCDWTCIELQ